MTNTAEQTDPLLGATIDGGRYEVLSLLGEGGMGRVYRARQTSMDRMVALKILKAQANTDKTLLVRFQQEALSVSRLRHPNTITVFDFGKTEGGALFIAMELLGGLSMGDILAEQIRLPEERALHLMRQVASAVAEAHQIGVVHRDLKPENIQVDHVGDEREFVKVLDFGIAKIVHGEEVDGAGLSPRSKTLTLAGTVFGTPHYMSPEQVHGHKVDHRTDIYAMGCILYELIAGEPPFNGDTPMAVMMAQASNPPPNLRDEHPDVGASEAVANLILHCLLKDRDQRLQSASEFVAQVEEILLNLGDNSVSISRRIRVNPADLSPNDKTTANDIVDDEPVDQSMFGEEGHTVMDPTVGDGPTVSTAMPRRPTITPDHTGEVAPVPVNPGDSAALAAIAAHNRPSPMRWLIAGLAVGLLGVGIWALFLSDSGGEGGEANAASSGGAAETQAPHVLKVDGSTIEYAIDSTPSGAQVTWDRKLLGTTPLKQSWPAGRVIELTFTHEGRVATRTIKVGLEPSTTLNVPIPEPEPPQPEPSPTHKFSITSDPPGAMVSFEGKLLGETPLVWAPEVPDAPKSVSLSITREGFQPASLEVELTDEAPAADAEPVAMSPVTLEATEASRPEKKNTRRRRARRRGRAGQKGGGGHVATPPDKGATADPPKTPDPKGTTEQTPSSSGNPYEKVPLYVKPPSK